MSWNSEFASHWHQFLEVVETRIRKEVTSKDRLGIVTVNTIVQSEISKWDVTYYSYGDWLHKLKQKNPTLGDEFHTLLKRVRLSDSLYFEPPPSELRVMIGLALVSVIFILQRLMQTPWRKQIYTTTTTTIVLSMVYKFFWPYYRGRQIDLILDQLRRELGNTEQKLHEIVARADSLEKKSTPKPSDQPVSK